MKTMHLLNFNFDNKILASSIILIEYIKLIEMRVREWCKCFVALYEFVHTKGLCVSRLLYRLKSGTHLPPLFQLR